jgi:glucosamine--fructose-6-phosphate aminotransferase (isomerizing)
VSDQPQRFLEDVLAGPESLAHVLDVYRGDDGPLAALDFDGIRSVRFVGMGSSRFAAMPAASLLRAAGRDAFVERASAAEATPPAPDVRAICVSAGATTTETLAAARRHAGTSRVVAVTNAPESPLAGAADVVLPLEAGEELGGVACRTYQATVAVLLLLAGRLLRRKLSTELQPAVAAAAELRDGRERWLDRALEILGGSLATIAPEERQCTAEQAALIFREGPRIPAAACETGDWSHVDVYLTRRPGYRALLFAGSRHDREVVTWLCRRGCAFVAVGEHVEGAVLSVKHAAHGSLAALLCETTVADLLAAELWGRALTHA